MKRMIRTSLLTLLLALLIVPTASAVGLGTELSLLIGHPPADGGPADEGILIVPGIVIPTSSDIRLDDASSAGGGERAARLLVRNTRLKQVAGGLLESLRLGNVDVRYQLRHNLRLHETQELPAPSSNSGVQISVRLLGFNSTTASYEVQFRDGETPITKTPLTVQRGKQAVVGGLDGPEAPYLFLVLAPDSGTPGSAPPEPILVEGAVTPPIAIQKIPPAYTQEARESRIQGVVVVQTIIDREGRVADVEVLKGLPLGLTKAAVDALRTWTFEPATLNGEPVDVYYNLTVNFRLDK